MCAQLICCMYVRDMSSGSDFGMELLGRLQQDPRSDTYSSVFRKSEDGAEEGRGGGTVPDWLRGDFCIIIALCMHRIHYSVYIHLC